MMPRISRMLCSSSTMRTRASATGGRNPEGEDGAGAGRGVEVDLAAVVLDDAVHEGEAQAAPTRPGRVERLEHVVHVGDADAVARVGDLHRQATVDDSHEIGRAHV